MGIEKQFAEAQRLHRLGHTDKALRLYDIMLEAAPENARVRIYRAVVLSAGKGRVHDAVAEVRRALQELQDPTGRDLGNAAVVLKNGGYLDEAEQVYRQALARDPDRVQLQANYATVLMLRGKLAEARERFLELADRTEEPAPWLNLARIYLSQGRLEETRQALQSADDRDPAHADVTFLKARLALENVDHADAFRNLHKTLKRDPSHREAWKILRNLDVRVVDSDVADELVGYLVKHGTQSVTVLCAAVGVCRHTLAWTHLAELERRLDGALDGPFDRAPSSMAVFDLLASNVSQRGHRRAAGYTWQSLFGRRSKLPARTLAPSQERRRIKVAFLSHDFRMHAGGTLVVGLLEHLPKDRIEWWAYVNSFADKSAVRDRARASFDRFVNVSRLDDGELAEKMQEDGIDVVIDLNGLTSGTRIGALAHRPVPVQVVWKGMPGSMGAGDDVGYIIGDRWVIDADNRDGFAENVIQLPRAYQPNDHQRPNLDLAGSRADHKLPDDTFVFASFNQHYKISPDNFEIWCRILKCVPDSVLWLMAPKSPELVTRIKDLCGRHGVDPERLIFGPILKHEKHVARLTHADLILDTWPYNAHTTCSDALRAGTPVLTVPGRTFAARVAASVLDTAALSDWIRRDGEDYVETAVRFAGLSRSEIEAEKQRVYDAYWSSPMVDNAALGRQFEAMCLELYRVAAGEAPRQDLAITEDARVHALDEFGVAWVAE